MNDLNFGASAFFGFFLVWALVGVLLGAAIVMTHWNFRPNVLGVVVGALLAGALMITSFAVLGASRLR